jgi:hypothetical protein
MSKSQIQTHSTEIAQPTNETETDYAGSLPRCTECSVIIPSTSRLDDGMFECPHCRGVFEPWEVFDL